MIKHTRIKTKVTEYLLSSSPIEKKTIVIPNGCKSKYIICENQITLFKLNTNAHTHAHAHAQSIQKHSHKRQKSGRQKTTHKFLSV